MRMNRFVFLLTLACIGIALMLAGNAAAQNKISIEAEVSVSVTEAPTTRTYRVGDTATLTITLKRNGSAVGGQAIEFEVLGIVDSREVVVERDPDAAKIDPEMGTTNSAGKVTTNVTFNRIGRIGVQVTAPNFIDATSIVAFRVGDPPRPTRIVATPNVEGGILAVGDTFTYSIEIKDVDDLAAWQMDLAYNPAVLEVLEVREGDFLASDEVNAAFQSGTMSAGKITGLWQARVGRTVDATGADVLTAPVEGVGGDGELLQIDFRVLEFAEDTLGLNNVHLSNTAHISDGDLPVSIPDLIFNEDPKKPHERISYHIISNPVVVTHRYPREDVNRDKHVNILDLVAIASDFGVGGSRADVNNDGVVNVMDIILVARHPNWAKEEELELIKIRDANDKIGSAPLSASVGNQPADLTPETIQGWIDLAQVEDDGSAIFDLGIANLERLLHATVPEETKLLLNYPNPFNPETWIPYQLAKATDVTVSIYSVNGTLVRTLALGHQAAGVYQSKSQAAYWDGRNELGEQVASGVYFYTLTAGDFSATGKMLVRK